MKKQTKDTEKTSRIILEQKNQTQEEPSEVVLLQDLKEGLLIELHSARFPINKLTDLGINKLLFLKDKRNNSKPSYIN